MANQFPTTRWSVVLGAARLSGEPARAISELCEAYWRPLYAFLRRDGMSPEDAEDTVQGFLATLLSGSGISGVERERGRFRSYLLGALRNYAADQRDKARALKRGGGVAPIAIDASDAEARLSVPDHRTPEAAYAYAWGMEVLHRGRARLRARYAAEGRESLYEALEPFLLDGDPPRYRSVAAQLSMTEANARVAVHRLRTRFGAALRQEVADTLDSRDQAEIDAELRAVIAAVRG